MDKRESEQLRQNNSDCRYLAEQSSRGDLLHDLLSHASNLHAAQSYDIHREIQKEHIRVEMLETEIAKKRVLEAEVRRELLQLESELALSRATTGMLLQLPKHPRYATIGNAVPYEGVGAAREGLDVTSAARVSETSTFPRGTYHGFSSSSATNELRRLDTIHEDRVALSPDRRKRQTGFESLPFERATSGKAVDARPGLTQGRSSIRASQTSLFQNRGSTFSTPSAPKEFCPFQRESNLLPAVSQPMDTSVLEKKETSVDIAPFTMGLGGLRIQKVIPVTENGKEKKKIILMPNPEHISDEGKSGSKRKAASETPPPDEVTAAKLPQENSRLKKKGKQEWSCAICMVATSTEAELKLHLQGKKHKLKVASIRNSNPGKNCSIQFIAKRPCTEESDASLPDEEEPNSKVLLESKKPAEMERRKGNSRFWCDLCQIGTPTQRIMEVHKLGKKHMKLLAEIGLEDNLKKKNEAARVDCVKQVSENGNSTTAEIVDKVSEKAGLEDYKLPNNSKVEKDGKDAELTEQEPVCEADAAKPDEDATCDAIMTEAGDASA